MTVLRVPSQHATIADAIAAAQAGDTILVACGFYAIPAPLTINTARLRIEGESPSCTILQGTGSGVGIIVGADAVTVRRLTLRNFDTGIQVTGDRDVVRDNRVLNCGVGIQLSPDSERTLVMGNTVADTTNEAILVETPQNYIIGNRISNAGSVGIRVTGGNDNVLIAENRITGTESYGIAILGDACWITNNVVQKAGDTALNISGNQHYVHGNTLSGGQGHGISLTGGDHVVLYNKCNDHRGNDETDGICSLATTSIFYRNEMSGNRDDGYEGNQADFNMIVANTAQRNSNSGIVVGDNGNQVMSNRVERNGFAGIWLDQNTTNTVVEDNRATKNRGDGGVVLTATPIDNTVVRFNTACGNKQFDVNVNPANFVASNDIELNRCDRSNPSQLCERCC